MTPSVNDRMKPCWTCRQRRHVCDGAQPHCNKCQQNGVECLGYGKKKPLKWVAGVAVRGPKKDYAFDGAVSSPLAHKKYSRSEIVLSVFKPPRSDGSSPNSTKSAPSSPRTWPEAASPPIGGVHLPLMDPMIQDFGHDARFLIDYFDRRLCPLLMLNDNPGNPYRQIISHVGSSPAIKSVIMAASACHYAHGITGMPLFSTGSDQNLSLSNSGLANHYMLLKQNSFRHLSEALANPQICTDINSFIAAFLLTILDLFETGANSWSFHLEGAKKLLTIGLRNSAPHLSDALEKIISDLVVVDTVGSTLVRPGVLSGSIDPGLGQHSMNEAKDLTSMACPAAIVYAIQLMTSHGTSKGQKELELDHVTPGPQHAIPDLPGPKACLQQIREFDASDWAIAVESTDRYSHPSRHDALVHCGKIWQLAADIYATRTYYRITKDFTVIMPSVDQLIEEFSFLEADDEVVKCLIWPAFIAGAESTRPDQREWVVSTMDRIWRIAFTANCKNAALVLMGLWEKQDLIRETRESNDLDGWDWMREMSLLDDQWIFY